MNMNFKKQRSGLGENVSSTHFTAAFQRKQLIIGEMHPFVHNNVSTPREYSRIVRREKRTMAEVSNLSFAPKQKQGQNQGCRPAFPHYEKFCPTNTLLSVPYAFPIRVHRNFLMLVVLPFSFVREKCGFHIACIAPWGPMYPRGSSPIARLYFGFRVGMSTLCWTR